LFGYGSARICFQLANAIAIAWPMASFSCNFPEQQQLHNISINLLINSMPRISSDQSKVSRSVGKARPSGRHPSSRSSFKNTKNKNSKGSDLPKTSRNVASRVPAAACAAPSSSASLKCTSDGTTLGPKQFWLMKTDPDYMVSLETGQQRMLKFVLESIISSFAFEPLYYRRHLHLNFRGCRWTSLSGTSRQLGPV
jgi:hypothetical protein